MTQRAKDLLGYLDEKFDSLQKGMLEEFGNEGSDIGDAGNAKELLGNALNWHASYTPDQFINKVCILTKASSFIVLSVMLEMLDWQLTDWE